MIKFMLTRARGVVYIYLTRWIVRTTIPKIIIFGTVISILNQGGVKTPRVEVSTIIGSPRPFFTRYYVSTYHIKTA